MSKPQVIVVPPNAGIGTVPPIQVPLGIGDNITLINLSSYLGLTLCNDNEFNAASTWPLYPGSVNPQPGINNLWIKNPHNTQVSVLVLQGIIPAFNPQSINQGGLSQIGVFNLSGGAVNSMLPTPPVGYGYRMHSVTCINQTAGNLLYQVNNQYEGILNTPFFAALIPANDAQSFVLNGLIITTPVTSSPIVATGIGVNLYYDTVLI